jgi:hypothetical protein
VSQQDISRATVERLLAERAATGDPAHAAALESQIRLHAEMAGLEPKDFEAVARAAADKLKAEAKNAKPAKPVGD